MCKMKAKKECFLFLICPKLCCHYQTTSYCLGLCHLERMQCNIAITIKQYPLYAAGLFHQMKFLILHLSALSLSPAALHKNKDQ